MLIFSHFRSKLAVCVISLVAALTVPGAPSTPEEQVRALERRWLDAYEARDAQAMDEILAPGFVITYPNGSSQTRDEVMAFIRRERERNGARPHFRTEGTTASVFPDMVVLRGTVISDRSTDHYTDTYVRIDGRWRVAASHLSAAGEPAVSLPDTSVHVLKAKANGVSYKLYVALPTDYATSAARYPVLYVLDADYAFAVSRAIVQHLSDRKRLPQVIVVGIAYDGPLQYKLNRTRDYTPLFSPGGGYGPEYQKVSGGGPKFLQFMREQLFPYVDAHFRTQPSERGLAGHSYGGLFTNWVLVTAPSTFNRYIIVSPSLWYANRFLFDVQPAAIPGRVRAYLAVGSREGNAEHDMVHDLAKMKEALATRKEIDVKHEVFDDETHDSVFPTAVSRGIRFVFGGD